MPAHAENMDDNYPKHNAKVQVFTHMVTQKTDIYTWCNSE